MEITLSPEDNTRLANLCGALDENIKQIEGALEVQIARRGSHIRLSGDIHNMRLAAQLLENFYVRAKNPIGLDEIQLAIDTVKRTRKPLFLEIKTFRVLEHCGPNNDDHLGYRTESEIKKGLLSDPLNKLEEFLLKSDINFESERSVELAKIDSEIESAFEFAENSPFPETTNSISDVFKAKI